MTVFKCKMCGGDLEVGSKESVATCPYCDTKQTLPRLDDDRRANLYDRANHARRNNEYDKAAGLYEAILHEDPHDAEAYWSLVLCKYGVEYVEDPHGKGRITTCNRASYTSVLTDSDYLSALEHADGSQKAIYEQEAKSIDTIQKGILEISSKEDPFDVFICYKQTDDAGARTRDSVLAHETYSELSEAGFRVFFAEITLEDILGSEYEPYIFAALQSAKVMIVVGSSPENFNAVWVKNEWSRYLALIASGEKKMLIPAYQNMDPYDLPEAFSHIQAQDMSKLGFMQDLLRGVKKIIGGDDRKTTDTKPSDGTSSAPLERLLKNGQTFLDLMNYPSAKEVYATISKDYPEDYRGWWGLIACKTKNFSLVSSSDQSDLNVWLKYVKQLATPGSFSKLEETYIEYTRKLSDLTAAEDIRAVNNLIEGQSQQILQLQQKILQEEANKKNRIAEYNRKISEDDNKLSAIREGIVNEQARLKRYTLIRRIGILIIIVATVLVGVGSSVLNTASSTIGIIAGVVGTAVIIINSHSGQSEDIERKFQIIQTNYKRNESEQHKQDYARDMGVINNAIASLNSQIAVCQSRVKDCNKYLELGESSISSMFFAQKCKAFGVEQSFDQSIITLRNAALGVT